MARHVCWAVLSFAKRPQIPHFLAASLTLALRLGPGAMFALAEIRQASCSGVMLMFLGALFPWAETSEMPTPLRVNAIPRVETATTLRSEVFILESFVLKSPLRRTLVTLLGMGLNAS